MYYLIIGDNNMPVVKISFAGDDAVTNATNRIMNDANFVVGARVDFSKMSNPNFDESTFKAGDYIQVPDGEDFDKMKFSQKIPGANNPATGVIVKVIHGMDKGMAKRLYFSSCRKRVIVYNPDTLEPVMENGSPKFVESKGDIADKLRVAGTVQDMADVLKGKVFQITENPNESPCLAATYNADRKVDGTRTTHVYSFVEIPEAELANIE